MGPRTERMLTDVKAFPPEVVKTARAHTIIDIRVSGKAQQAGPSGGPAFFFEDPDEIAPLGEASPSCCSPCLKSHDTWGQRAAAPLEGGCAYEATHDRGPRGDGADDGHGGGSGTGSA